MKGLSMLEMYYAQDLVVEEQAIKGGFTLYTFEITKLLILLQGKSIIET